MLDNPGLRNGLIVHVGDLPFDHPTVEVPADLDVMNALVLQCFDIDAGHRKDGSDDPFDVVEFQGGFVLAIELHLAKDLADAGRENLDLNDDKGFVEIPNVMAGNPPVEGT